MADVLCPMVKDTRPMSECLTCGQHVKDGTSNEWCGYRAPQPPKAANHEIPTNALEMQMRRKLGKAEFFYKTGKTRIADNLSQEAAWLERKIRRMKRDVQQNA